jgi:hypothetical protein
VNFVGNGTASVDGHESQFPLNVTLIGVKPRKCEFERTDRTIDASGEKAGGGSGKLAGIVIPAQENVDRTVVIKPDYQEGDCTVPDSVLSADD